MTSEQPPANGFVRVARRCTTPWLRQGLQLRPLLIFAGALMASPWRGCSSSASMASSAAPGFGANDRAAPGECYYYMRADYERIGIILHLGTVLPAAFLVCFQFLPVHPPQGPSSSTVSTATPSCSSL